MIHCRRELVQSLKKAWIAAKRRAGITRKLRLYDIRLAFATHTLADETVLKSVSKAPGHSGKYTTLPDGRPLGEDQLRRAVERVSSLVNVLSVKGGR